ncbi:hypothetical protein PAECIP111893_03338 [Paenibacillus plantiphilus]|uniref:Uncharacterized protein n=1 Tax=Paenibacillus plantiphilus TaxID=2905650 RepID=A0ABM9CFG1_9BACL|nr:hypothetical protein PAECIP111893_03338 [Paenibacillus plantiphilus]
MLRSRLPCGIGTISFYFSFVSRKYRVKARTGSTKGCCKQEKSCYRLNKATPIALPATFKRKNLLTAYEMSISPALSRKKRLNDGIADSFNRVV